MGDRIEGHGGELALAAARLHGVRRVYTLSGAHVFPVYDAAVTGEPPTALVDVRHEQTAVFAAEAEAKLTRRPALAVLTAGPGVTNGISAVTTAHFNGTPLLVLGGRAPAYRWGSGALQELDQPPLLAPVTKRAATVPSTEAIAAEVDAALTLATSAHRGPVFLDVAMDHLFGRADVALPATEPPSRAAPDTDALATIGRLIARAERPVLVLGSDVWSDGAEGAARDLAEGAGLPVVANGMARGILPRGHPQLVTRARSHAFGHADLVVVAGTPLDFRLGYGAFGGRDGSPAAPVIHLADAADQVAAHVDLAGSAAGDLSTVLAGVLDGWAAAGGGAYGDWLATLQDQARAAQSSDRQLLSADSDPIHPARVYGELLPRLDDSAVVIGDGGDFVSFAGRYVEPARPGCWLDPGPYGCLGTGLGYTIAARLNRPDDQLVLLLGDGAAGLSLMDVDTLVRHHLPVAIVCGNNSAWGLEKHPMRMLYGYDVAADLQPRTRYDDVVRALGGAGELVTRPSEIGPALDRALAAGVPYLVNVVTDPEVAYPRSTTGI